MTLLYDKVGITYRVKLQDSCFSFCFLEEGLFHICCLTAIYSGPENIKYVNNVTNRHIPDNKTINEVVKMSCLT